MTSSERKPGYYWYRDPAWEAYRDAWGVIRIKADSIEFMGAETVTNSADIEAILSADLVGPIDPPST